MLAHRVVNRTTTSGVAPGTRTGGKSTPGAASLLEDSQPGAAPGAAVGPQARPRADAPVRRLQPPRDVVRTVECPKCAAAAGESCRGRRGPRKSNHLERVELATELRFGQRLVLPRTGARTHQTEEVSRGAVSLDSEAAGATLGTDLDSPTR